MNLERAMAYLTPEERQKVADAFKDADRYRWLKARYIGADFAYNNGASAVMLFELRLGDKVNANLDRCIDEQLPQSHSSEES